MTSVTDLYQAVILDHNRAPRGEGVVGDATNCAEGFNPICGDRINLTIKLNDAQITNVGFTAQSCALCRASASVLAQTIHATSLEQAIEMGHAFQAMLTGGEWNYGGDAAVFAAIKRYPARAKCVALPWRTLVTALTSGRVIDSSLDRNSATHPVVSTEDSKRG